MDFKVTQGSILVIFMLYLNIDITIGSKVLIVAHSRASHPLYMHALAEGILEYGHQVYTILHPDLSHQKAGIVDGINVLTYKSQHKLSSDNKTIHEQFIQRIFDGLGDPPATLKQFNDSCYDILGDEQLILTLKQHAFDLAIADVFQRDKCLILIPHVLNVPFIYMAGVAEPSWHLRIPSMASVIPIIKPVGIPMSERMSFMERTQNFVLQVALHVYNFASVTDYDLINKYRRSNEIKDYDDIAIQAEMIFSNRDHLLEYPRAFLPNVVPLGGLTARDSKPLPVEWARFVDEAKDGFILVSFGSVVDSFSTKVLTKMADAFKAVKYHVIWRMTNSNITQHLPKRIKVQSWIPQNDLLGHPNIKVCMTHAGNNGQYEALYHGVPMIALPLFGDQKHNGLRIEYRGYGRQINLLNFTSQDLKGIINDVAENKTYKENVKLASQIMRNRPMNARQLGGYWVDHVIKFGSRHMRSHAYDMPLYQFLLLDVILFLSGVFLIAMFVLTYCFYKTCCAGKVKSKNTLQKRVGKAKKTN